MAVVLLATISQVRRISGEARMIKKIASLLLGVSAAFQSIAASVDAPAPSTHDRWMVYSRIASDGRPLVVVARTGNAEAQTLLLTGHATVVTCQTDPTNVNNEGMPQETDRLYSIEDKVDGNPALLAAGAVRMASVTGQGVRRIFLVHRKPLDLAPLLRTDLVQGFYCSASSVDDRQALAGLVTPTLLESS